MVAPFTGVLADLEAKSGVKPRQVRQAMWLKKRVGLPFAVLDFVQRTVAARSMTKVIASTRKQSITPPV